VVKGSVDPSYLGLASYGDIDEDLVVPRRLPHDAMPH